MRINDLLISGHLGQDAKETVAGNTRLVTFSIAYSEGTDEKKWTNWYTIKVWGNQGREWLYDEAKNFRKGDFVVCKGRLKADIYAKQDDTAGLGLEVSANWFGGLKKADQSERPMKGEPVRTSAKLPPAADIDIPF